MTNEAQATRDQQVVPIETTLLRITVVFRVIGALWLVVLSLITLVTEDPRIDPSMRTGLIMSAIGIAVIWTIVTVALAYNSPTVLASTSFLIVDVGLAAWVALTPSLVASDSFFAGGYPISAAFLAATTHGMGVTAIAAAIIAGASVIGAQHANARTAEVLAINLLSPLVVAWGFGTIRTQDKRRREAEETLTEERAKLVRAHERSEMAAHLHDSVLQTLALIRRRVHDSTAVLRLARRQERELRAWLEGESPLGDEDRLNRALAHAAEEIEDEHDVVVVLSTAGDTSLDDRMTSLVLAAREAMTNSARFSGVERIFVLSEAGDAGVRLVVRDRGSGFDLSAVPEDRRGIRESIVGRLDRLGGTAEVRSAVGEGTEVDLYLSAI